MDYGNISNESRFFNAFDVELGNAKTDESISSNVIFSEVLSNVHISKEEKFSTNNDAKYQAPTRPENTVLNSRYYLANQHYQSGENPVDAPLHYNQFVEDLSIEAPKVMASIGAIVTHYGALQRAEEHYAELVNIHGASSKEALFAYEHLLEDARHWLAHSFMDAERAIEAYKNIYQHRDVSDEVSQLLAKEGSYFLRDWAAENHGHLPSLERISDIVENGSPSDVEVMYEFGDTRNPREVSESISLFTRSIGAAVSDFSDSVSGDNYDETMVYQSSFIEKMIIDFNATYNQNDTSLDAQHSLNQALFDAVGAYNVDEYYNMLSEARSVIGASITESRAEKTALYTPQIVFAFREMMDNIVALQDATNVKDVLNDIKMKHDAVLDIVAESGMPHLMNSALSVREMLPYKEQKVDFLTYHPQRFSDIIDAVIALNDIHDKFSDNIDIKDVDQILKTTSDFIENGVEQSGSKQSLESLNSIFEPWTQSRFNTRISVVEYQNVMLDMSSIMKAKDSKEE